LLKKHLFLIVAVAAIGVMLVLGAIKVVTSDRGGAGGPGGPGGPGGFAGGPGGGGGGFGGFGGGGFGRGQVVTPAVIAVRTFTDKVEVLGAAKAIQSITVTAPASQLVTRIAFQSGQFVRKGQVLAELNAQEQDAVINQNRSQVALAKSNWDRWQGLADRGIAPAATAETYKAQYDQAVATLQASQARAGDRVIRAPFSGMVGLSDAAPGMLLNAGGAIATLDDLSVIRVDFPVPEQYISLLHDGLAISATADAYPGTTFKGHVARIDTRLDPTTRSIAARAEFPNPGAKLRPGMLMRVSIDQARRQNPAAPESAVVFEGGDAFVLVITPAPAGAAGGPGPGQARQRPQGGQARQGAGPGGQRPGGQAGPRYIAVRRSLQTGVRADGWVEVLSGLKPGERVVSDGTNRIRPNDPVSLPGGGRQGQGGQRPGAAPGGQGAPAAAPAAPTRTTPQDAAPAARPAALPAVAQGGPAAGPGGFDPAAMFRNADANRDGGLSLAEWTGAGRPEVAFSRLDGDGDGRITLQEMQQRRRPSAG
jgi:membrane fusion protein (multidrug efflux system)